MRKQIALAFIAILLPCVAFADCTFSFLPEELTDAGTKPGDVASGDFNQDGRDDLAIVNRQSGNVAILIGQSGGTFATPAYVEVVQNGWAAAPTRRDSISCSTTARAASPRSPSMTL